MVFGTIGTWVATSVIGLAAGSAGATIVGGLIGGGLAFGTQTLLGEYVNRPKDRTYSAISGTIQVGGNVAAEAVYGKGKTKGHRLYYAKYGSGDEYNSEVLALSNGWCDGLEPYVYFYGEKHNLVQLPTIGDEVAHYGVEDYWYDNNPNGDNCFSIRFYDGRPGQQVDQKLVADTANLGTPWKANSTVAGHTYVVLRMRFDGDHDFVKNGRPELEFVLRGLRLYDPRKDSTVAGGSGTHRINDPATWEFGATGENPALQRLNYQLGLRGLISDRTIIGEGKTLGQIDLGSYFASMNVCDTLKSGKPTYKCSLIVNGDDDHTQVLKEFDDAMAGYGLNRRGLSGVIAGAPQLPVLEITEADIPADRAKEVKYRKSAFELFNHMSGQFTSIEDNWKPTSLKPIYVNADVAVDGRKRQTAYDFLQVTDPDIAQYLLTIRYRQQRRGARYDALPVSMRVGLQVTEGQWVLKDGRQWLVQGWNLDENFNFTLTLAETSADIYDDGDIEPGPIVVPSVPPINPSLLSTVQNFNVAVGLIAGGNGHQVPALQFTWTPPADATIDEVLFEFFIGTDPAGKTVYEAKTDRPELGTFTTSKDIQPYAVYTARATIRTVPDRLKTFTPWVTTATATGAMEVYPPGLIAELEEFTTESQEWVRGGVRDLLESARALSVEDANAQFADYFARQQLRREVNVSNDRTKAEYIELVTVQISEVNGSIAAVSQRLEELTVQIDTDIAQAIDLVQVQITEVDGEVAAQANAIQSLFAALGGNSASVNIRIATTAAPSGYEARYAIEAAVDADGNFRSAALFIDVPANPASPTRVVVQAGQFIITDGTTLTQPFVFSGGIAYMENARIGSVIFNELRSANGKLVMRGSGSLADISIFT